LNNDRPTQKMEESNPFPFKIPVIADYRPIRVIGTGSFGQVWIALDATGSPCALKIIHKGTFDDEVFWKEFEGVKNYLPISRSNMGLVTILHVGKDPQENFYYYTMELADNANDLIGDDWKEYEALSLSLQINQIQMLYPLDEFEEIAINLASGLAHLHENGLVHRDIKPSNVIFINGKAKLADVGLVTKGVEASTFIGTAGYIPPEGPGMPAADVYALGKTFYELLTGKGVQDFPELPTMISDGNKTKSFAAYNLIVAKSCAPNYLERIQDGSELLNSLKNINKLKDNRKNKPRSRFPLLNTLIFLFFAALLVFYYDREFNDSTIIASLNEFQEMYSEQILSFEPEETIREENDSKEVRSEVSISNNTIAEFFLPRAPFEPMEKIKGNEKEVRFLPRILQVPMDSIESDPIEVNPKKVKKIESKKTVQEGVPFQWSEMKITMPWIPPGSFLMGSPESETDRDPDESPRITQNIANGFWLSSHEVTQDLYYKINKINPSNFDFDGQLPVENISWNEATDFCLNITRSAQEIGVISEEYFFSLPTEKEWEYSCRAGSRTAFSIGESVTGKQANFKDIKSSAKHIFVNSTTPVGSYPPNKWGLNDMHGNVAEWTSSRYLDYPNVGVLKPKILNSNTQIVARGGAWNNFSKFCRSAYRNKFSHSFKSSGLGFRISLKHL
jgi:formylglycine-generating enzyme required for sulfatase activity